MRNQFKIGDTVMLMFGSQTIGTTRELRKFDEQTFKISKAGRIAGVMPTYELDGCVSKAGTPFTIIEDWLVPCREVSNGCE